MFLKSKRYFKCCRQYFLNILRPLIGTVIFKNKYIADLYKFITASQSSNISFDVVSKKEKNKESKSWRRDKRGPEGASRAIDKKLRVRPSFLYRGRQTNPP
jgi:hypothetical protein